MEYYCDNKRHLVCKPYTKENLHKMAEDLGIKKDSEECPHDDHACRVYGFCSNDKCSLRREALNFSSVNAKDLEEDVRRQQERERDQDRIDQRRIDLGY